MKAACRHCHRTKPLRPRQLCWDCYYAPGIRDLYPVTHKFGQRGVGNGTVCLPPNEPTPHPPGSAEKIMVMRERVKLNQGLFHPLDAGMGPDALPAVRSEPETTHASED